MGGKRMRKAGRRVGIEEEKGEGNGTILNDVMV